MTKRHENGRAPEHDHRPGNGPGDQTESRGHGHGHGHGHGVSGDADKRWLSIALALLESLEAFDKRGFEALREEWLGLHAHAGRRLRVRLADGRTLTGIAAGLDGIEKKLDPGPPINKNIYKMSHRERRHLRIDELLRRVDANGVQEVVLATNPTMTGEATAAYLADRLRNGLGARVRVTRLARGLRADQRAVASAAVTIDGEHGEIALPQPLLDGHTRFYWTANCWMLTR